MRDHQTFMFARKASRQRSEQKRCPDHITGSSHGTSSRPQSRQVVRLRRAWSKNLSTKETIHLGTAALYAVLPFQQPAPF